ncbi:MAG: hypothetical protein J6A07_02695 [Firmicutes bacterium]|nr:hypothetical protein [Bacillota bacterium]
MPDLNNYYVYKSTYSGSGGGGGDGCLIIIFAVLVGAVPLIGVPVLLICLFLSSFGKKY